MSKNVKAVAVDAKVMELVTDLAKSRGSTNQSVVSVLLSEAFDRLNVDAFEYEKAKPRGRKPGVAALKQAAPMQAQSAEVVQESTDAELSEELAV